MNDDLIVQYIRYLWSDMREKRSRIKDGAF